MVELWLIYGFTTSDPKRHELWFIYGSTMVQLWFNYARQKNTGHVFADAAGIRFGLRPAPDGVALHTVIHCLYRVGPGACLHPFNCRPV